MLLVACLICAAALGAGLRLGAHSRTAENASGGGWPLAAWTMAGLLTVWSTLGILSVGLFILPLAAIAWYAAGRLGITSRNVLGALIGAGLALAAIALWHVLTG